MEWQGKLLALAAAWAVLCGSLALARDASPSKLEPAGYAQCAKPAARLASAESLVANSGRNNSAYYQQEDEPGASPFREEPEAAPLPDEAYDTPPAPARDPQRPGRAAAQDPSGRTASEDCGGCGTSREGCGGSCTCRACERTTCCRESCEPTLGGTCGPSGGCLSGVTFGGWLDQGVTVNGRKVADRFNGPITFNDRDGEYQMNQLYLFVEKKVDTGGHGWDIGGRIDGLYGTDWRFTKSYGLEDDWNQSERFYGAALPQCYADVAVNDLSVRMGHYYSIIGYEVVTAPDNFFYSHGYAHQYGEPFTHTGLLASHSPGDQWTVSAGLDRGWDMWEDNNHDLSFLGGVRWRSPNDALSAAVAVTSGPYDDAGHLNRTMYSVVVSYQVTSRLKYIIQHDYGIDDDGGFAREPQVQPDAEWYGINQYMVFDINQCWAIGARMEWFRDDDGTRVGGIGAPHGWTLGPDRALNQPGWAGDFCELTLGINWKPTDYINVRPECRWDWYDGPADGAGRLPYDAGTRDSQFTFATDLIVIF